MNEERKKVLHGILNNLGNPKDEQDLLLDGLKELKARFVENNKKLSHDTDNSDNSNIGNRHKLK